MREIHRKIAKRSLLTRLIMFIQEWGVMSLFFYGLHPLVKLPSKYYYSESAVEHYERCVREGNGAYVASPPMIAHPTLGQKFEDVSPLDRRFYE